jgi:uncharacterized protein YxjI
MFRCPTKIIIQKGRLKMTHQKLRFINDLQKRFNKFLLNAKEIHGDLYDYSLVTNYTTNNDKVLIKCNRCNHIFPQKPRLHTSGKGCPHCNVGNRYDKIRFGSSTYKNRKTTLYYVKINDMYKIGLTLQNVKSRYATELKNGYTITTIKEWVFEDGIEAFNLEKSILRLIKKEKYQGKKYLLHGGDTELFTSDILEQIIPLVEEQINPQEK